MLTYVISPDTDQNPDNNLTLIIGLVVGFVGLLIILSVLMIIIVLRVLYVRQGKSSTFTEQPVYDYITPQRPSTQSDRIELNENQAYGNVLSETSETQFSTLRPTIAYGVVFANKQRLNDEIDNPEPQDYEVPIMSDYI